MKRRVVLTLWILSALAVLASILRFVVLVESQTPPDGVLIHVAPLVEASGLAPSHRVPGVYWSHNDSGGEPVLYAFDTNGQERGRLRVQGTKNVDWEAISSFEWEGKAYIAIGDVGDNLGVRHNTVIHIVEEPAAESLSPTQEVSVPIAWSIPFRYENGPHDCESLMIEPRLRMIYLITKRNLPPGLYALPLQPIFSGKPTPITAKKIGTVAHLPRAHLLQRLFPSPRGRYRGQPTDACFAPDGLAAAVLTYGEVLIYHRNAGQTWESAFQHEPEHLAHHSLPQAEGLTYSLDGKTILITGEQRDPRLVSYVLRE